MRVERGAEPLCVTSVCRAQLILKLRIISCRQHI
jgi:hypothetical protein